jgi:hypothetical protein
MNDYRYDFPGSTYPGDGLHVYAVERDPGVLRFYVDGTLILTRHASITPWFDNVFNRSAQYHLRLTSHVGGCSMILTRAPSRRLTSRSTTSRVYQR